jgi:hypothetical protein
MQFKHPEILYFLFLLVIPILVHLFQLRKFETALFTNVKFLKELDIQTRKSSKIKKYLLLATRLLLLAAIIIAFAQPFFKAKDAKNASNELYIVLDNSNSMQAKGEKGELLKRAVQELLESTPEKVNFSLITCSENFWNTDIKTIQKELQNLDYSSSSFQIEDILAKIRAHKTAFNKDIFIISDGVGLQSKQIQPKEDETFFYHKAEPEKNQNVAIDSVFIQQTTDDFYEIGVNLKSYGAKVEQLPIALYNNSKLIAKTIVSFETPSKTLNFTIPKQNFHGYVSTFDNSLSFDNTYFFTISNPKKTSVLSIGSSDKSGFLKRIYTEKEFQYANFELSNLDYNVIDKQDAIVINELEVLPPSLQTSLKSFVEKGGNLIVIPNTDSKQIGSSFVNLIGSVQFQSLVSVEKQVTAINYNHPLFSGVFEKKVTNFQYPTTKKSWQLKTDASAVLSYSDQTPFLINITKGVSNIYVFAAALNKENSNFQNAPLIVPVFYKMVQSAQKYGVQAMVLNDTKPFILSTSIGKDEIVTLRNEKENFIPSQQLMSNKVRLSFDENPKKAGNFTVFSKNTKLDHISFNDNRIESNISNPNFDSFDSFDEVASVSSFFSSLEINRIDSKIWKWFAVIALICLVLEILIQKFIK